MTRFHGKVGFGQVVDAGNGVHEAVVEYRFYQGNVLRNYRSSENDNKVNSDLRLNHVISIVSDEYANQNTFAIRYAEFGGGLWEVTQVEVQSPRLLLTLGGKYNGPAGSLAIDP